MIHDHVHVYVIIHVCVSHIDSPQLQKAAATWILKTHELHRIPLSVMDSIIQDVQSLYAIALSSFEWSGDCFPGKCRCAQRCFGLSDHYLL